MLIKKQSKGEQMDSKERELIRAEMRMRMDAVRKENESLARRAKKARTLCITAYAAQLAFVLLILLGNVWVKGF